MGVAAATARVCVAAAADGMAAATLGVAAAARPGVGAATGGGVGVAEATGGGVGVAAATGGGVGVAAATRGGVGVAAAPAGGALQDLLEQLFYPSGEPLTRDLDYVEVFAGDCSVSKGLILLGYKGRSLDLRFSREHNVLGRKGFLLLLALVARLRPGGLLWAAPPCSTWVFLALGTTKRNEDPAGDRGNAYVQSQNALVERLLLISAYARARGCAFIWEQPSSTRMFDYPPVASFLASSPDVLRIRLEMGAFGLLAEKETILIGNAPYLPTLQVKMSRGDRLRLRLRPDRIVTARHWVDNTGKKKCQGSGALKRTQSYPLGFGSAHAEAFARWDGQLLPVASPILTLPHHPCLRDFLEGGESWEVCVKRETRVKLRQPRRSRSRDPDARGSGTQ